MPITTLIVISDLHLADGHTILEGFRSPQQEALTGLLKAIAPGGSLGLTSPATLVINGDCFDFLAVPPYLADGLTTPHIALAKLAKIVATHPAFFMVLQDFLNDGGSVVFLVGNHDIELCFQEVRAQLSSLLVGQAPQKQRLIFHLDQGYQPFPDVYIEHGNQYDPWNYASGIWDEHGRVITAQPERIRLPFGTQYMHRAALPISEHYPYFEHFDPLIGYVRQIALLSLFDPAIIIAAARQSAGMMSPPHQALQNLLPGDEQDALQVFSNLIPDFALFQENMFAQTQAWAELERRLYTPEELAQEQIDTVKSFFTLHSALQESVESALAAIFQPIATPVDDSTTRGLHHLLHTHPALRVATAGHTHMLRHDLLSQGQQAYLNTATWIVRYAPPVPEELTPEVVTWLRHPDQEQVPFANRTDAVFVWISGENGQPSTARLCAWEGGEQGHYRLYEQAQTPGIQET